MRRFFPLAVAAVCTYLSPPTSSAAVISRDWKTPDDGLLTFDTVNKREWLDLSQSILSSEFPGDDPSPHFTRELRYQYVASQTGPGGLFEGFTVGTAGDVIALAHSASIDTSTLNPTTNGAAAAQLLSLVGPTYEGAADFMAGLGLLDEPLVGDLTLIRPCVIIHSATFQAGVTFGRAHFQVPDPPGVMMYRAIPEPTGIVLIAVGLGCLRSSHWRAGCGRKEEEVSGTFC
jgi:hypothetical protein